MKDLLEITQDFTPRWTGILIFVSLRLRTEKKPSTLLLWLESRRWRTFGWDRPVFEFCCLC